MKRAYWILLLDIILILMIASLSSSCSIRKFYPLAGSVVGGSAGSLGGPAGAALGAGTGWTVGELAKGDSELAEAKETIEALTSGDVETLVNKGLKEQEGTISKMLDEVWSFVRLCLFGVIAWNLLPILYTRYVHKKSCQNEEKVNGINK